jgi:two-component system response regulator HydG
MNGRIWICDDEAGMLRYLKKMLETWGVAATTFAGAAPLFERLRREPGRIDLLLLDIKLGKEDGIEVLRQIKRISPDLMVVMMTAHGSIDSAVEAMRLGAFDYLSKPFPQEKLFSLVQNCLERKTLLAENLRLKERLQSQGGGQQVIFVSAAFRELFELTLRVATINSPVLILGESGTGKELIATSIHCNSPRQANKLLAINCAALTETLLESQLFGHIKGAFTGAVQAQKGLLDEANGGTLFLDEVGDLSPALQAKLLRVLQQSEFIPVGSTTTRQVNVRFIAATNKDLEKEVAQGRFREDLYYRLNVITLQLPPLRDRLEDIEPLTRHFLAKVAGKFNQPVKALTDAALQLLKSHSWPGNVRELENVIERSVILARSEIIDSAILPLRVATLPPPSLGALAAAPLKLREAERLQVQRALYETGWHKSRAASRLGVTRKTLDKKIRDYELAPEGTP